MKRYLTYILLIISSICYGQIYSTGNRMYGTMSTPSYDNYKNINGGSNVGYSSPNIGYSTSRYGMTNTYNMYERQYGNQYDGTYNPGSSGRPSGPRKVHGYTSEGEYVGDDNGDENDFWENGYEYYWDGDHWWRKNINSNGFWTWQIYTYEFGWHWSFIKHGLKNHPDPLITPQSYKNPKTPPYEPYADPIGEFPIGLLLILSFLFVYYNKKLKNKTN